MLPGVLAYNRRMRYERWLVLHRVIGLLFLAGAAHAATEPGTIADFEPLRTWIVVLLLAGGAAWLYRIVLFARLGPRYPYRSRRRRSAAPTSSIWSCGRSHGA